MNDSKSASRSRVIVSRSASRFGMTLNRLAVSESASRFRVTPNRLAKWIDSKSESAESLNRLQHIPINSSRRAEYQGLRQESGLGGSKFFSRCWREKIKWHTNSAVGENFYIKKKKGKSGEKLAPQAKKLKIWKNKGGIPPALLHTQKSLAGENFHFLENQRSPVLYAICVARRTRSKTTGSREN